LAHAHEFLLTAIRGDAKRFNDHSLMSWLQCDRGAHSAKPEQVRSFLQRASPGPYLEMFAQHGGIKSSEIFSRNLYRRQHDQARQTRSWLPPGAYRKFRQKQRDRQRGDAMMTAFVEQECAASKATATDISQTN
jgi:hypothetical protein